jgi:hypothetical protein
MPQTERILALACWLEGSLFPRRGQAMEHEAPHILGGQKCLVDDLLRRLQRLDRRQVRLQCCVVVGQALCWEALRKRRPKACPVVEC